MKKISLITRYLSHQIEHMICEVFCPNSVCCVKKPLIGKRNPCRGKRYFKSSGSSTYVNESGRWSTEYLIGSAKGFYGNDTVRFGGVGTKQLVVNGTKFGQANIISDVFAYYLIGSAKGFYGNDTVRFGGVGAKQLVVKGTKFGQANIISDEFAYVSYSVIYQHVLYDVIIRHLLKIMGWETLFGISHHN
ncbi:unnamed protein product [Strongylus vulgaris]|uniref:Peptidase A1 domain-containing protein n=1 Tax=Strongylus vulgaris TaxID=40348 RepID=A0A3P7J3D7_STRVU|nr:unnamed protein product [Strongylus vulgaris]